MPTQRVNELTESSQKLAKAISIQLLERIKKDRSPSSQKDVYTCVAIPEKSIEDYLLRIIKYLSQEESIYIFMLIYINRYFEYKSDRKLNHLNVHRLIACSVLLAYKFYIDELDRARSYVNSFQALNKVFSLIAGLELKELNRLEFQFYSDLRLNLFVSKDEYNQVCQKIKCKTGVSERDEDVVLTLRPV